MGEMRTDHNLLFTLSPYLRFPASIFSLLLSASPRLPLLITDHRYSWRILSSDWRLTDY